MSIKLAIIVTMGLLMLGSVLAPIIISDPYLVERYVPSPLNLLLFSICIILIFAVRDPLLQIVCGAWTCWFLIGNLFIVGSHFRNRLVAPLYVQDANSLFLLAIASFILGVLVHQRAFPSRSANQAPPAAHNPPSNLALALLFVFPLAYVASLLLSGAPTIVSGENIVHEMYEVGKGPLYSMRAVLVLSILALVTFLSRRMISAHTLIILFCYLVLLLGISVIDGKRDVALIALIGIAAHLTTIQRGRVTAWQLAALGTAAISYALISDLRSARLPGSEAPVLYLLTAVGVEYKDYVHSINYLSREYMASLNYDWVLSSIGSLLNRTLLEAFAIDKDAWVQMDSARAWMRAYRIDLGIRTGIVSELYYAFGYWMLVPMGIFGLMFGALVRALRRSTDATGYIVLLALYGNFALAIMSQTSAVLGVAVTLGYAYLLLAVLRWLLIRRHSVPPAFRSPGRFRFN